MPSYIDPASLKDQPLIMKRIGEEDYSVRIAGRAVGRIMAKRVSGSRVVWFWTLTGPYIPAELLPSNGDSETIGDAKAAFRAKFDRWREWAARLGHPAGWNG